jgi:hypothetical protein
VEAIKFYVDATLLELDSHLLGTNWRHLSVEPKKLQTRGKKRVGSITQKLQLPGVHNSSKLQHLFKNVTGRKIISDWSIMIAGSHPQKRSRPTRGKEGDHSKLDVSLKPG